MRIDMDTEQITADLNRRFAEPLPEFYKRRIIVWHDEEKEFEDKLADIQLNNAKIAALTGTNYFAVKKLLEVDDPGSNYLLYSPISYETPEDNWLLDIELYSEEFRADLISIWMDEMGLPQTPGLRSAIKPYRKFMNAKERRKRIMLQTQKPTTAAGVQLSIMAALAGLKDATPAAVIKAVLCGGLHSAENHLWQDFVNYGVDEAFWRMVAQVTGYQAAEKNIEGLAVHIMLTASTRTVQREFTAGLEEFISAPHQAHCYDFVSDWLYAGDSTALRKIAEFAEETANLRQRFMKLTVADLVNSQVFPCVNEIILVKLMQDIKKNIIDPKDIRQTVEKRRTFPWYEDVKNFFEGLYQVANIQEFYKNHSGGFHTTEAKKIWEEYTSDYYKMDTCYRFFYKSYEASLKVYHKDLSDIFSDVKDVVERIYVNWFLEELGANWSDAVGDDLQKYGSIEGVPLQTDFYRLKVASSDFRAYVIISDAMRYEVAAELAEVLRRETQSKVELGSMQGIFPTVTKFGMAALLPHKKLTVGSGQKIADINCPLKVMADGKSTEAGNRDKLLKTANPKSIALKYKDIINMKRAERGALVRGMDVVYIYHDTVDEAGHKENSVFEACSKAIDEIKNMARIITGEFGGTHILITSDHGFLYTFNPLREYDKVGSGQWFVNSETCEIAHRYVIMKTTNHFQLANSNCLLPVKFLGGNTAYDAFAPRGSIRIKMKGGGLNFVHGGISLQEMTVPLIDYRFLRSDSKEYKKNKAKYDIMPVTISLLSAGRKISNMNFSLTFYQKEAATANFRGAAYQMYFTDNAGKQISDVPRVIADKTEEDATLRTFRVGFNLKPLKYDSTETYYLVIVDEKNETISREEFQIDIALAVDELDLFR